MLRSYFNKFNRGEIDENAMARDDVDRINNSASLMENWVPKRLGPMQYRPGTEYLDFAATNIEHYMIPFLSQGDESAIMEFSADDSATGTNTLRIWIDDALMTMTATVDTITNGDFDPDIAGWTDDSDTSGSASSYLSLHLNVTGDGLGDWGRAYQTNTLTAGERTLEIWIAEAPVYCAIGTAGSQSDDVFGGWLNPGYHALTFVATATDYTITFQNDKAFRGLVQSCDYHAGGTWELVADFFVDDSTTGDVLRTVRYAQTADQMFLTTNGYEMGVGAWPYISFKRRATKSWTFELPENTEGPFGPINDTSISLTPGATKGNTTLTASTAMFKADAFGDNYELIHGSTVGRCKVTAYTSPTVCQVRITADFGGITATLDWYKGLFGYGLPGPTALEMFEGRMWLAGAGFIHGSVADQYTNFDARLEGAEAAIMKTIGFGTVQDITWMLGGEQLLLGLSSEELTLNSNGDGDVITPTNARIRRATSHGSAVMRPMVINKVIFFAQRALKKLISITGLSEEGVETEDITLLTPDILDPGIKRMIYVGEPEPRIWVLLTDGELRVYLFDKAENIRGWSRVTIGGGGTIVDIVSTPTNTQDAVYVIVDRSGSRTVEKFANFEDAIGQSDSRHYDSHIYYSSPGTTITGLAHLEGLEVNVWGDGIDRATATVASGQITVTSSWTDVVVGVRHTAKYLSNRLGKYLNSSVLTDEKRVVRMGLVMRAVQLRTIKYGPDANTLQNMPEIEEGRLRAPTLEEEAQIVDLIDGTVGGAIDAWDIEVQDQYAYAMCQTVSNPPESFRDEVMTWHAGNIHLPGGLQPGSTGSNEMWGFNVASTALSQLTDMGGLGVAEGACCSHDGAVYVGGASTFKKYTIATDTWETVAQPTNIYTNTALAAYDGKVYMYGGGTGGSSTNNWAIYDIALDSWDYTAYLGTVEGKWKHQMEAPQSGTGAGKLYAYGGYTGSLTESNALFEYNIGTNTWSSLAGSSAATAKDQGMASLDDGYLYIFGGAPRLGNIYEDDLRRYDISGNTWSVIAGTGGAGEPETRMQFGMTGDVTNGRVYIYGGYNGNLTDVYPQDMWYWDTNDSTWNLVADPLSSADGALRVVDTSDLSDLVDTASLNLESADQNLFGWASVADGDYLYGVVSDSDATNRGFAVVDISAPASPSQVGYLEGGTNTTTIGRAIEKIGNTVFFPSLSVNGDFESVDVTDPTTPVSLDTLTLVHTTNAVNSEKTAQVGQYIYVPWESHLHIIDVSDPSNMVLANKFALSYGALNSRCYLETTTLLWVLDDTGIIHSYDLTDPTVPVFVGSLTDATNLAGVEDFAIVQPYMYALQPTVGHVFDLTDPTAPVHFVGYTGFTDLKSFATKGANQFLAGSTTSSGIFYAADQRSNRYVDYDERPFEFDGTYDTDSRVFLQAQGPATVLAITYDIEDSDNEADDFTGPRNN